jgi:hypothetical protein
VNHEVKLQKVVAAGAILKAARVGEFIRIAAGELAFKKALKRAHRKASEKVIAFLRQEKPETEDAEKFAKAAKARYDGIYVEQALRLIGPHVKSTYHLAKSAMVRRINGKIEAEFVYDYSAALDKADAPAPPSIELLFGIADERAIQSLSSGFYFWFADHYDGNVSEAIKTVVADEAIRQGRKWSDVARDIEVALKRELGLIGGGRQLSVPSGWRGTFDEYFEALAASVTTTARVASSVKALEEIEAPYLVIVNPEDEKTCDRCMVMSGKRFPLSDAVDQMSKLYSARNADEVKEAQPWYSEKEFLKISNKPGHVSDADSARLAAAGVVLPTYHFRCRCTVDIASGDEIG